MTPIAFARDGLKLAGYDIGNGPIVVFQHGMGGDEAQVAEAFPTQGFRRITLECRGQGQSEAGDPAQFSIAQFADDVLAFADSRGVEKFVIGGISMGAAIALRIAVTAPERVKALILARPAWGWDAAPENMSVYKVLPKFLENRNLSGFQATPIAKQFAVEAPDNYVSLIRIFDKPDLEMFAQLGSAIANSGPEITEAQVRAIKALTLVLANAVDLIHPIALAKKLSSAIAKSHYVEITPKAEDRAKHFAEFQAAVTAFLKDIEV
jgi:pimeloyl-ACP methyl ester carboxylesterase